MLRTARQWGELGEHIPDACVNIVMNPKRPVARYLDREELERLGATLDRHREEHRWPVAALRLLILTGARLSEVLYLRWDELGELSDGGGSARLGDSKTGPRTIWLGPEAAGLVAALPRREGAKRVFPEDLTSAKLYTFWCGIREKAGLPGMRIHDARHTWASQGIMNGVGLTTVGRLLGHRRRTASSTGWPVNRPRSSPTRRGRRPPDRTARADQSGFDRTGTFDRTGHSQAMYP